jgi:hypothetical protein
MEAPPVCLYLIIQTDDDGYAIVGCIDCRGARDDVWVIKLDSRCSKERPYKREN